MICNIVLDKDRYSVQKGQSNIGYMTSAEPKSTNKARKLNFEIT